MHISLDRQITSGSWLNQPVKVSRAAKSNNPPPPNHEALAQVWKQRRRRWPNMKPTIKPTLG